MALSWLTSCIECPAEVFRNFTRKSNFQGNYYLKRGKSSGSRKHYLQDVLKWDISP